MKTCVLSLILFAFVLAGCNSTHYDLELTPDGKQMQRRLSTTNTLSETHITHLKQLYPKYRVEQHGDITNQIWSGVFTGTMPSEFGGFGVYESYSNPMGTASLYMERFSGTDDVYGLLEQSWQAIDVLVDHLVSWLDTQFEQEKGYPALHRFLDKDFRRDLKNLRLFIFQIETTGLLEQEEAAERALAELWARQALYLVERGYFKLCDLPAMARFAAAVEMGGSEEGTSLEEEIPEKEVIPGKADIIEDDGIGEASQSELMILDKLLRFVAGKMQVKETDPLPEFLAALKNPKSLQGLVESFPNHFQKTRYFQDQLKRIKAENEQIQEQIDAAIKKDANLRQKLKEIDELQRKIKGIDDIQPGNAADTLRTRLEAELGQAQSQLDLPQLKSEDPHIVYEELLDTASGYAFQRFYMPADPDQLYVKLKHSHRPLFSNGNWLKGNEAHEEGVSKFKGPGMVRNVALDNPDMPNENGLPAFCYVAWVLPDEKFQKTHFGEVLLEKAELAGYCLWHASLTAAEAAEWNGFVKALKPATYEKQFHNPNLSPSLKRRIAELSAIDALHVPDPDAPPLPQSEGCSN